MHSLIYLFVCIRDNSKSNEQIFLKVMCIGSNKCLTFGKDLYHILNTKENLDFSKVTLLLYFSNFGFVLDITPNETNGY